MAGTRENANGVDLNRNWDVGWRPDSYGPSGLVPGGGGTRPFSEPETRALARYLVDRPFVAAIFLHSKGGLVVPGSGSGSAELASGHRPGHSVRLPDGLDRLSPQRPGLEIPGQARHLRRDSRAEYLQRPRLHAQPAWPARGPGMGPRPSRTNRISVRRRCRVHGCLWKLAGNLLARAGVPAMPLVSPTS